MKRKYENRYKVVIRDYEDSNKILDTLYVPNLYDCLVWIFNDTDTQYHIAKSEVILADGRRIDSYTCFPYTIKADVYEECVVKTRNMYVIAALNRMVTNIRIGHIKTVDDLENKIKILAKVSKRNKNRLLKWLNRIAWCRIETDNSVLNYDLNQVFDFIDNAEYICNLKVDTWFGETVIKGGR